MTKQYEITACKVLRQLGVNGSYVGFHYAVYGILDSIENPENMVYVCKGLYAEIAQHYHVNISNVEGNIRTIVNVVWKSDSRKMLNHIFGKEVTSKPENAMFMEAVMQYVVENSRKEE